MATIGFVPIQNTYVSEYYSNRNFASSPTLFIGQYLMSGDSYRTLLQFDLCSRKCNFIPPDKNIVSALLQFYVYRNESVAGASLTGYWLVQDFNQNEVTWDSQPRFNETTPGGRMFMWGSSTGFFNMVVTDLVRRWHEGTTEQHGIIITGDERNNSLIAVRSSYYYSSTFWPRLIVTYN